jgi:glycosyltransferase involved in cell wall biosynthesis
MARILFVNKGKLGGPSYSLLKLLAVVRQQHEVQVLLDQRAALGDFLQSEGIPFQCLEVRYRGIPGLARMLKRQKVKLVYLNSFTGSTWRVLLAAKVAGCKIIWHIREIVSVDAQNPYRVRRRIRYADQIIAVSQACRASVEAIAPHTPVTVVYNGIDLEDFQFDPDQARQYVLKQFDLPADHIVLVSTGTITQRKNQGDAVRAVEKIIKENPKIHLFLLGENNPKNLDYLPVLRSLIEDLQLQDNIHITGFRRDINQILCGAEVCIHTALVDPHPRAVLEALGAGLPVVAYDVDGVGETLVDGKNGYLIPSGDIVRLEERIRQLIGDPGLRRTFARNGRQTIQERFTDKQTAANVLQVIEKVLHGEAVN